MTTDAVTDNTKKNILDFIHIFKFFESVTDQGSSQNQSVLLCELIACDPPLLHPPEKRQLYQIQFILT